MSDLEGRERRENKPLQRKLAQYEYTLREDMRGWVQGGKKPLREPK